jgi:dihydrofolate reductase
VAALRTLLVFESLSLDGYFTDAKNDMSWAHAGSDDPEFAAFTAGNASGGGALVFGRVTYQMMAGWWPSPAAAQAMPEVAGQMNALPKIVFSRTLERADWSHTTLYRTDPAETIRQLKSEPGPDLVVLGSGRIVALLARAGLVDQYQLVYVPVVLGGGRTLFEGLERPATLRLLEERTFRNGKIVARYAPG